MRICGPSGASRAARFCFGGFPGRSSSGAGEKGEAVWPFGKAAPVGFRSFGRGFFQAGFFLRAAALGPAGRFPVPACGRLRSGAAFSRRSRLGLVAVRVRMRPSSAPCPGFSYSCFAGYVGLSVRAVMSASTCLPGRPACAAAMPPRSASVGLSLRRHVDADVSAPCGRSGDAGHVGVLVLGQGSVAQPGVAVQGLLVPVFRHRLVEAFGDFLGFFPGATWAWLSAPRFCGSAGARFRRVRVWGFSRWRQGDLAPVASRGSGRQQDGASGVRVLACGKVFQPGVTGHVEAPSRPGVRDEQA